MSHFWEVVDVATKERLGSTSSVGPSTGTGGGATGRKTLKVKASSNTAPITTTCSAPPSSSITPSPRPKSAHQSDELEEKAENEATATTTTPHQRRHHTHHVVFDSSLLKATTEGHNRPRAKSTTTAVVDDGELDSGAEGGGIRKQSGVKQASSSSVSLIRRWSETSSSSSSAAAVTAAAGSKKSVAESSTAAESMLSNVISIGSSVKVLVDYRPIKEDEIGVLKGQMVSVLDIDSLHRGGYLVRRLDPLQAQQTGKQEGWVPTYVLNLLTSGPRKPAWTFRKFRKPSFSNRKDSSVTSSPSTPPATVTSLAPAATVQTAAAAIMQFPVTAKAGEKATLSCNLAHDATNCCVLWRGPRGDVLLPGGHKYSTKTPTNAQSRLATLSISNCQPSDAGDYSCTQVSSATEEVIFAATIALCVSCK